MRKNVPLALLVMLASFSAFSQDAAQPVPPTERRIALVIGNSSYPNVPLKNPVNDARDLNSALKGLGFEVTLVADGDMATMSKAVRDFGLAIRKPEVVALFYYSGHGVQYRGANYLIPAKADIQDPDELAYSAVNAEQVYAKMESSGDKMNIVILDACRNNPFPGAERSMEKGLAIVGNVQPPQSLIVYATAPGKTAQDGEGRNGVFTAALLKHIAEPNLDIELMMRRVREDVMAATKGAQVPWQNSSISGSGFSFLIDSSKLLASATSGGQAAAPAGNGKSTGTLTLLSDPPGVEVLIDGKDTVHTPVSLELAPGAHSFEPKESKIKTAYFAAQSLQWITVAAGYEVSVPIRLAASKAQLRIKFAQPGCRVFVNNEDKGMTPLGILDVNAGRLSVRFEREGQTPQTLWTDSVPNQLASVAWGGTNQTPIQLEKRTIKLDGKTDSWEGLDPLCEKTSASFMGEPAYGMKSIYMCKDDKYLYWRIDFNEKNPFFKTPKNLGLGMHIQLICPLERGDNFKINLRFARDKNSTESALSTFDAAKGKETWFAQSAITIKHSPNMIVERIDLNQVQKNLPTVRKIECDFMDYAKSWDWRKANRFNYNLGYIDFMN